ncbi:MAG: ankyrin repeat domain-containing protein [Gemmatimonadota bacterium]
MTTTVSPVLAAAYQGDLARAAELAAGRELDIFEATVLGDGPRVEQLLGADPARLRAVTADGWSPLHLAGFFGRAELARRFLALGADPAAPSANYMTNTALHAALAGARDRTTVEVIARALPDPDIRAAAGYTPLMLAASRGDGALVELLMGMGADPGVRSDDGKTAADYAGEHGHAEVAARLRA